MKPVSLWIGGFLFCFSLWLASSHDYGPRELSAHLPPAVMQLERVFASKKSTNACCDAK